MKDPCSLENTDSLEDRHWPDDTGLVQRSQARARRGRRTYQAVLGFCLLIVAGCLELMAEYTGDWTWGVALWVLIAVYAIIYIVKPPRDKATS